MQTRCIYLLVNMEKAIAIPGESCDSWDKIGIASECGFDVMYVRFLMKEMCTYEDNCRRYCLQTK